MTEFAYCRVSSLDQDTGIQEIAIRKAYPNAVIRHEKKSGTTIEGRHVLSVLLEAIGEGDKLVVWKLDRLARNLNDLTSIVKQLEDRGACLEILDQKIDTSCASGKAFLQMLGVFAEFETNLRKERQVAGIQKAKAKGKYKGRNRADNMKLEQAAQFIDQGYTRQKAADAVGVGVATLYRYLKQRKKAGSSDNAEKAGVAELPLF